MERIASLIQRLKEQADQQAAPEQMLVTVQLITAELQHLQSNREQTLGTPKVAVVLPRTFPVAPLPAEHEKYIPREPVEKPVIHTRARDKKTDEQETVTPVQKKSQLDFAFDPLTEIPTLSHQDIGKEVNRTVGVDQESLNEKLKQPQTEVVHVLKETPVKDLRKAIGINDRFLFINDLFRGDENLYERCIKTINSFNIYAEAEYWINRELKVKLGWNDESEATAHFYQLVKRRFS